MNMQSVEEVDVMISPYGKIKVFWDDLPENYSKEGVNRIKSYMHKMYGVPKDRINVEYRPIKRDGNGGVIYVEGANTTNIMDREYQLGLMKEWLKRENKTVEFERIIKLDDKVSKEIDIKEGEHSKRRWGLSWLFVDNFLSFGESNYINFDNIKGLTIVNSLPANQAGKTTLTVDALKFLLYGSTTKTNKNEEIFNQFSDKNTLTVRGLIHMDGDFIIERTLKRSPKKAGGWNVTNVVNYYDILPDGSEKKQTEEDATVTTEKIKSLIGSEDDFEMLLLTTESNLDDLINLTSGESTKFLNRLIGLEVLEQKEAIVRKMYNEFDKKKKGNIYNIHTLQGEIDASEEKVILLYNTLSELELKLVETKNEIQLLNTKRDELLKSKEVVDVSISTMNPDNIKTDIEKIKEEGINLKEKINQINKRLEAIGLIELDEQKYQNLSKNATQLETECAVIKSNIQRINSEIDNLIKGGICEACNRKLDDVDNTDHIKEKEGVVTKLNQELIVKQDSLVNTRESIASLEENKKLFDEKNRLELERDRNEVTIEGLRNKLVVKNNELKQYESNITIINKNKVIDIEVEKLKTEISVCVYTKDTTIQKIENTKTEIQAQKELIINKKDIIGQIHKESEVDKIYKIYIEIVGKKGIGKLVLRSVLPVINSEIQRLLEDVCDFNVELFIDDKNDIHFHLLKDDVVKLLKSGSGFEKTAASISLRAVLGKITTLPMPNFISFDEVLGKVSMENLDKAKSLFDKIKDMYSTVFLITHNDIVKDWGDNIITVEKINNISKVSVK